MRVLVLGANGLLGSNVVAASLDRSWETVGTFHTEKPTLDATLRRADVRATERFVSLLERVEPDSVVNCAAMTDVDACETAPERARSVNGSAPGELARACDARDVAFAHVSTDYVFDGEAETSYDEFAETNPIQVYGESKLAGERAVREAHRDPLLVRLSFVYGVHRATEALTGFPAWVRDRFDAGERTPLFTDQRITPSRAGQAAETILDLLRRREAGTYHVASRTCTTPYEIGVEIGRRMDVPETLLQEGDRSEVDRPARRPTATCLDVNRVETTLGRPQPTLAADIDAIADGL